MTSLPDTASPRAFSHARQVGTTLLGEVVATAVSIGAVYAKDYLFHDQNEKAAAGIANIIARYRGTSGAVELKLAGEILDITAMHLGGLANVTTQFALRRAQQSPETRTSFLYEAGRLLFGRCAGTVTSIGTLALAKSQAPGAMRYGEGKMESLVGAVGKLTRLAPNEAMHTRLAELMVSNLVQSAGAVAGNAPAQLLFDKLMQPKQPARG